MTNTRFDLEQQILDCWGICDDLQTAYEAVMDADLDTDRTANLLLGLKELYQLKFEKTFETFENLLKEAHTEQYEYHDNWPFPTGKRPDTVEARGYNYDDDDDEPGTQ